MSVFFHPPYEISVRNEFSIFTRKFDFFFCAYLLFMTIFNLISHNHVAYLLIHTGIYPEAIIKKTPKRNHRYSVSKPECYRLFFSRYTIRELISFCYVNVVTVHCIFCVWRRAGSIPKNDSGVRFHRVLINCFIFFK